MVKDPEEIRQLYDFIKKFPEDYPSYFDWVDQCFDELRKGHKQAFVYRDKNNIIIANLIFQQHKKDPKILELKNGRVDPKYRRKKIFSVVYRAVEGYAREKGYERIIGDCRTNNIPVIETMQNLGFSIDSTETLYENKEDVMLVKDLIENDTLPVLIKTRLYMIVCLNKIPFLKKFTTFLSTNLIITHGRS